MIIGGCPYCDFAFMIPIASGFEKHACENCGKQIWTRHSRFDPESWTEDAFAKRFEVNEAAHTIKDRFPEPEPDPARVAVLVKHMTELLLYGNTTIKRPRGIMNADD